MLLGPTGKPLHFKSSNSDKIMAKVRAISVHWAPCSTLGVLGLDGGTNARELKVWMLLTVYTILSLMWPLWWRCSRSTFGAIAMWVFCNSMILNVHCVCLGTLIVAHRWLPCSTKFRFISEGPAHSYMSDPTDCAQWRMVVSCRKWEKKP